LRIASIDVTMRCIHSVAPTAPDPSVWDGVAARDPEALVTQTRAWIDCVCAVGGYEDATRVYELRGRTVVFPMIKRRIPFTRHASLASLPQTWGFGGVLAEQRLGADDLNVILTDVLATQPLRVWLRPNPIQATLWSAAVPPAYVRQDRSAFILDLDGGFAKVWEKRFSAKTRNLVRKAERAALEVKRCVGGSLMPVFHELYTRSVVRWADRDGLSSRLALLRAARREPLSKYMALAAGLGERCHTWVAWHCGRAAAAVVVLQGRNTQYFYGAMDKDVAGPTNANDLLQRLAIEDACNAGCRHYHMGASGESRSLAHFKARFGAQEYAYGEYRYERLPLSLLGAGVRTVARSALRAPAVRWLLS
jgi:Acetyltransferase (GNAT) domain